MSSSLNAVRGRRYATIAFAIPLLILLVISAARMNVWGDGARITATACSALTALPPLSFIHLEQLRTLAGSEVILGTDNNTTWPSDAAALSLAITLADAEPELNAPAISWSTTTSFAPLRALAAQASAFVDISIARPSRVMYASVADVGLLEPVSLENGDLAYVAPAWALPASLSLNDWPLRRGLASMPLAFPVDFSHDFTVDNSADGLTMMMPYLASPTTASLSPSSSQSSSTRRCINQQCHLLITNSSTKKHTIENGFSGVSGAPPGPDSFDIDGSLGRSLISLVRDTWRSMIQFRRRYSSSSSSSSSNGEEHPWPCAPEYRAECTQTCQEKESILKLPRRQRWCLTRQGAQILHVVHYIPPAEITPLFFQGHDDEELEAETNEKKYSLAAQLERPQTLVHLGSNVSKTTTGRLSLSIRNWGDIHIANAARLVDLSSSNNNNTASASALKQERQWSISAGRAAVGSLRAALGINREWVGDNDGGNLSQAQVFALLHRWITVHDERTRHFLDYGLCALTREERPPYIPDYVAVSAAEAVTLLRTARTTLLNAASLLPLDLEKTARETLRNLRLARFRAQDISTDPSVSADNFVPITHLAAIYAPWWIPLALPVILSIVMAFAKT